MDTGSLDPAAALRRAGLRVTASRLAVLTALAANGSHQSVDAVVSAVRERLGDGSPQTVYNVLRTFTDAGLVRRIEPAGRPGLYELRVGDNHHHLICRTCGRMVDVDCAVGDTPCLTAADDSGYEIDEAEVIYWGRCPECVAATAVSSGDWKRTRGVRQELDDTALDPEQPRSRAMSRQKQVARKEKD
ncbi:MAG: Fur family transcriptional regulator [Dehalococcoidia bacterium]